MNPKRKGSAGERELAAYLTAEGFPAHRNDQRYVGGTVIMIPPEMVEAIRNTD